MTVIWSYLILTTLTFTPVLEATGSCPSRNYGPRDTCSLPDTRDYALPMLETGMLGSEKSLKLNSGRILKLRTIAADPPLFEIPNFLSDAECDAIIRRGVLEGLNPATTMGKTEIVPGSSNTGRWGETTFIVNSHFQHIRERIAAATNLPSDVLFDSEGYQIGHYFPGGYYRDHYDSQWESTETSEYHKICCHLTLKDAVTTHCSLCRYITVLMYLNDVQEGGETAFPAIDLTGQAPPLDGLLGGQPANCSNKVVRVKPEKGKALLWYNHHLDPTTGWLGSINFRSMHSGCDVIAGEKWIVTAWINVASYEDRYKPSIHGNRWDKLL